MVPTSAATDLGIPSHVNVISVILGLRNMNLSHSHHSYWLGSVVLDSLDCHMPVIPSFTEQNSDKDVGILLLIDNTEQSTTMKPR